MGPKQAFIDVYIESVEPLKFYVEPSPLNDPPLLTGPNGIIFENDHHAGFDIYFQLQGNTFGYYFPNDKHQAVWSETGSVCPDKTAVWNVLKPIKVFDPPFPIPPSQRTLLWAKNPNPGPPPGQGPFKYNLRVTNGSDWKNLDPGGDNMNGPISRNFEWSAIMTGIGSAVATAAALAGAAYLAGLQLVFRS